MTALQSVSPSNKKLSAHTVLLKHFMYLSMENQEHWLSLTMQI